MDKYHKIQSVFKRDEKTHKLTTEFSRPEFDYLVNNCWEYTEKIDGTNIRIDWISESKVKTIGGRTDRAELHKDLISELNILFPDDKFISLYPDTSMTLYGEGYGAGIQKAGINYSSKKTFVLFDVLINGLWLSRNNVNDIADKLKIGSVPVIGESNLLSAIGFVKKGIISQWGNFIAEGIVLRPKTELLAKNGQRIITKIKHCDF